MSGDKKPDVNQVHFNKKTNLQLGIIGEKAKPANQSQAAQKPTNRQRDNVIRKPINSATSTSLQPAQNAEMEALRQQAEEMVALRQRVEELTLENDEEKKRADNEKKRADNERKRADNERKRADNEWKRADNEWKRADNEKIEKGYTAGKFKEVREVWIIELIAYRNAANTFFRSESSSLGKQLLDYIKTQRTSMFTSYFKTVQKAMGSETKVLGNTSRSTISKSEHSPFDIFGNDLNFQSAHLMPHADNCSKYWYPVVSWVLPICDINRQRLDDKEFLQKCIHGFEVGSSGRKANNVGIKHLSTNRIGIINQESFDGDHRVLIVPLLTASAVCNWNGESYDAIILVKESTSAESAKDVYMKIGAGNINEKVGVTWPDCLATYADLVKAQLLLREAVLSFSNLVTTGMSIDSIKGPGALAATENDTDIPPSDPNLDTWTATLKTLITTGQVAVPTAVNPDIQQTQEPVNVRKIFFSIDGNSYPPPDPALLLAKAVSNWFHQNEMGALPACGSIESQENTQEDYNSSVLCTNSDGGSVCSDWELEFKTSDETFSDLEIDEIVPKPMLLVAISTLP